MGDKLFEAHEAARKAAEAATARYERSIREGGKAREKDDAGNKGAQSGSVRRALKGSK
jgi:hypothetical protein